MSSPKDQTTHMRGAIISLVLVNIIAPLVIYSLLKSHMSDVYALLLSGIPPAVATFVHICRERRIDIISSLSVTSIAVSAIAAALTNDARLLLVKDSLFTIGFGVAFWASTVCATEDLIWTYNRAFRGPDAKAELDAKYQLPHVRSFSQFLCRVWGTGLLVQAGVCIALIYSIPIPTFVYMSPFLGLGMFFGLGCWTNWYVACARAQSAGKMQPSDANTPLLLPTHVVVEP
ncbi:Aste57867_12793 [Aphanomyces stellatus]|uniref:Aste57867_12793 protein n=1 Tax=Aphanomyces stellatus TaxID=120398 RepID=A0A485KXA9_9STRA|nr:hypothetical protein As57867_012745 [Aphanomyces stellatus]VFT89642.1 Aste57867_12793 [Aphanomyces stellatus]